MGRHFAATDSLELVSALASEADAIDMARQRAKLRGRCSVFALSDGEVWRVAIVDAAGAVQPALLPLRLLRSELGDKRLAKRLHPGSLLSGAGGQP